MAAITVNGLNINDGANYLVSEVEVRSMPSRAVYNQEISRRPGRKITATQWDIKKVNVKGYIFGSNASTLRTLIDNLQQYSALETLALSIDTDRSYNATLKSLDIPTQFYNNTYVSFDAKFECYDPFAYGSQLTVSGTVVSGTVTYSGSLTVSGTVFAVPTLTINPKGANAGNSGIKAIQIAHTPSSETVTVSGTINYASDLIVDYNNYIVTNSGILSDYTGIFSKFEPGVVNYTITVTSGVKQGFNWKWSYQPRYYN